MMTETEMHTLQKLEAVILHTAATQNFNDCIRKLYFAVTPLYNELRGFDQFEETLEQEEPPCTEPDESTSTPAKN